MKLNQKYLIGAILSVCTGQTYAAGLERSPLQIDALFESGTYAEVGYTHMSLDVTGTDASGHSISNMAEDFQLFNYAVKTCILPTLFWLFRFLDIFFVHFQLSEKTFPTKNLIFSVL